MVAETLGGYLTGLLSLFMVGIYCRFIPFMNDGKGISPDCGCGVKAVMILRGFLMNV